MTALATGLVIVAAVVFVGALVVLFGDEPGFVPKGGRL